MKNSNGTSFHAARTLAAMADAGRPRILGHYQVDGTAMLGVIRIGETGTERSWERHDGGDELLVLLEGKATMTLRPKDGPDETHELGPGDALLIPRGVPHSDKLHTPELRVLFMTPREGNAEWREGPDDEKLHEPAEPWPDIDNGDESERLPAVLASPKSSFVA